MDHLRFLSTSLHSESHQGIRSPERSGSSPTNESLGSREDLAQDRNSLAAGAFVVLGSRVRVLSARAHLWWLPKATNYTTSSHSTKYVGPSSCRRVGPRLWCGGRGLFEVPVRPMGRRLDRLGPTTTGKICRMAHGWDQPWRILFVGGDCGFPGRRRPKD